MPQILFKFFLSNFEFDNADKPYMFARYADKIQNYFNFDLHYIITLK